MSAPRIGPLGKGDLTVLVSRTPESGWLKVVQFSSGRQGWVKAERLIVRYTKRPAPGVDLRGALLGTADLPALLVRNDSNKVLFLHLGATPEIEIPPQSTKKVTVPAGAYAYNVASPGSYPGFGSTAFVTGSEYVMTFYIRPKTGVQRAASPALMAEFNKLQAEVDTADAEVDFQKKQIDTDRASLTVQRDAWDRRSEDLEARRQKLDRTDQAAVDEFNRLVEAVNADLKSLEEAEKRFEALVALHNTKVDTVNAARKRLQGLGDKINATQ